MFTNFLKSALYSVKINDEKKRKDIRIHWDANPLNDAVDIATGWLSLSMISIFPVCSKENAAWIHRVEGDIPVSRFPGGAWRVLPRIPAVKRGEKNALPKTENSIRGMCA